jgi:hypothetical protein
MWPIWLALAEPLLQAFADAFGRALVDMVAGWRHDQAVADAAVNAQALAASEAVRETELAMSEAAAQPMTDAELLDALDGGRL